MASFEKDLIGNRRLIGTSVRKDLFFVLVSVYFLKFPIHRGPVFLYNPMSSSDLKRQSLSTNISILDSTDIK